MAKAKTKAKAKAKVYKYKAVNSNGTPLRGVLTASSEQELYKQLERVKYQLISCKEIKSGRVGGLLKVGLPIRDKIMFFKSLEQMLSAGLPLLNSLDNCVSTATSPRMRNLCSSIHGMVRDGLQLSEAMKRHSDAFSPVEISIIRSKEESGDLNTGFDYLVGFLKRRDAINRSLKKATRYPMMLGGVILVTVGVMLGYVTPQILEFVVLVEGSEDLPFATYSLVQTSAFFQAYISYVLIGAIASISSFVILYKSSAAFKYQFDRVVLSLPKIGILIQKIEISKFCATLSSLYSSGITFITCLQLSQDVVQNRAISSSVSGVIDTVQQGGSFHSALEQSAQFPQAIVQMVAIAEESGRMQDVFDQIVEFYDADIDDAISAMLAMIEPILTIILASLIIWIAAAVFGPIYGMFEDIEM